ncbi:aldo/keto reductase family protein [Estrella lausannensis]|uniref:Aldo-keto reductase n=1 Tax=Estrella lausannensis TaxID=483423 RepID=A0A0H5DS69_9BACT|nr:aldo/keto reductase [Estrella lausannensis]CRX39128.1 Aldo-keto reductase [Estrella lausannensis]
MIPLPHNIPPIGIGTHKIGQGALTKALEIGYRHLDLATAYQNLPLVANAIKSSSLRREELILTLKILPDDTKRCIEKALDDLCTDHLDFLLLHVPYTDFGKFSQTLHPFLQKGIVRRFGVSNFSESDLICLKEHSLEPCVNQIEIHPYYFPDRLIKASTQMGAHPVAYRPLAGGKTALLQDPVITQIAKAKEMTPSQIAIAWLLTKGIPCIVKSEKEEHLKENIQAISIRLTQEEILHINQMNAKAIRTCTSWIKTA